MQSKKETTSNKTPEFFLTFAMRNFDYSKGNILACPLDNKQIKDGYIKAEGSFSYGLDTSNDRKFKCFTLHPVINNKDIVPYTALRYGLIGYDLNADSMKIYAGGWNDLASNNNVNKLIENIDTLAINGKQGHLYLDKNGKVHEIMYNKVINRAELLNQFATKNDTTKIFDKTTLDSSFTQDNYNIITSKDGNNIGIIQKSLPGHNHFAIPNNFYQTYGIKNTECFKLIYDKNNHTFKLLQPNELIGIPIDESKGIKVDRIFVDKSILDITSRYWPYTDLERKQSEYSKYIQNIMEVLIENFPNGDIRIIDGQNFEIIKTEDFIKTYIQNTDKKNFYLNALEKKRESIQQNKEEQILTTIINSNNTNENNINNNDSDWHLCSCWKQCWDRCC